MSPRAKAYLALTINAIIWGAALPLTKPALSFVSPNQFLQIRYLIAMIVMLGPLIYFIATKQFSRTKLANIMLVESLFLIYLVLVYSGLAQSSALQASFIINTRPILITLMGIIILREVEERHEWFGMSIAVIGTLILLIGPSFYESTTDGTNTLWGNALVFAGVLVSVVYAYAVKTRYRQISMFQAQTINALMGAIAFSLINLYTNAIPDLETLTSSSVLYPALYMGILGTPVAIGLRNLGFKQIEASEASLFTYLQPLIYIPLAVIWLQEPLQLYQVFAIFIITTGIIIAEWRPHTHSRPHLQHH